MTIPAIGTTAIGRAGTTPEPSTRASTGATPEASASATQPTCRRAPIRAAEVPAAIANIASTNSPVSQPERRITVITSETSASCATARTAATTTARPCPNPP
ncbi:hypothetical protein GCM10022222_78210 [Amycolatopsis ultiminotia]|uniref:Uncharacterized protein n=1 Tax=Amycolatopsis ultiminotia TaxID=543629 RepID=A0ABP6YG62_9PSEU